MSMIHIGIDPGLTGAIAAIDDQATLVLCEDLPVIRSGKLAWIDSNELTSLLMAARDGRPARIIVERSQAMPGQGVSSTFCIGVVLGSILAACQRVAAPLELIARRGLEARHGPGFAEGGITRQGPAALSYGRPGPQEGPQSGRGPPPG